MKNLLQLSIIALMFLSCHKENNTMRTGCNMQQIYDDNAKKVTIASGIWGTLANMEGNCMPMIPPATNSCKICPVQWPIRIYEYTLLADATPSDNSASFFDSFNSSLIAEVTPDENGFFQLNIPEGHYSLAVVVDGKLYVQGFDGQGGLNPFTFTGGVQDLDIVTTYGAVF